MQITYELPTAAVVGHTGPGVSAGANNGPLLAKSEVRRRNERGASSEHGSGAVLWRIVAALSPRDLSVGSNSAPQSA